MASSSPACASAPPSLQTKARKPRSKSKSKAELLKKCTEDKLRLFEEQHLADLAEKVGASACVTGGPLPSRVAATVLSGTKLPKLCTLKPVILQVGPLLYVSVG